MDYEKLGAFYLGKRYDLATGTRLDEPLLYDAKDLTTHAVCVGMTGSGKTGLGVGLIEEAAIDGIPVIAIDPKGDLGNLLLTFPELRPADFRPWIDEAAAGRAGRTPDEHARSTADLWRKGLAEWDQGPDRIARFANSVDRTIYTPGSRSGRPISLLRSFSAPTPDIARDEDALRERVMTAASGLLGLIGIEADPLRSREHILLATIFDRAWREGRGLDLPTLIHQIQSPPIERIGVLDLESFYPAARRFEFAMMLNNLVASPGFAAWSEGEALDAARLLYTPEGRPRLSILSIAHLSESERMFFVTQLLNEVLTWMRSQPGSSSLRAILYMDEVFGYFPPTANPPCKTPMLTLLKQARAYGLGVVLATQNPVDLDYKGLSNAGTWFLGRLQTERDKARVMEGLEGASISTGAGFDRSAMERTLAGLGSRVFLMQNVHEDAPVVFESRWALSYLGGPMTRQQIQRIEGPFAERPVAAAPVAPAQAFSPPASVPSTAPAPHANDSVGKRPAVPPEVSEAFAPVTRAAGANDRLMYRPALAARATLHYANARAGLDEWRQLALVAPLDEDTLADPWRGAAELGSALPELERIPESLASFAPLPGPAARPKTHGRWSRQLRTQLYRTRPLELWRCRKPKLVSRPDELEGDFRGRVQLALREERDLVIEKLRKRYAPKLARLEDGIRRAEQRVEVEQSQYQEKKLQTAISIGATVLGALFGRKLSSVGRATTAARGMGQAARERDDIGRATERVEQLRQKLAGLEAEFEEDLRELREPIDLADVEIEPLNVAPRKTDTAVEQQLLLWLPYRVDASGIAEPAHEL